MDGSYFYVDQSYDAPEADANRLRVRNNYSGYGFQMRSLQCFAARSKSLSVVRS
jgi:hypothetical protein